MAIGDAAAAAGLTVYPSTQAVNKGFENDNQRGDDIAATRTLVSNEATARALADGLKFDTAKIIYSATTPAYVAGAIWLLPV